jgi:monoamine oxidase
MFQPVGGMDRIPYAFAKSLGDIVKHNCPIQEIRKTNAGVRAVHKSGIFEADYCICTLPISVLQTLQTDFSPAMQNAFRGMSMAPLYKIGWEAPRFWEKHYNIYGGISYFQPTPTQPIDLVWYPSDKLFSETGIVLSGFGFERSSSPPTVAFGFKGNNYFPTTTDAKLAASRAAVELLHPGHGQALRKPIYVSWQKIPYSLGCFAMNMVSSAQPAYDQLTQPDGRIFLAGDYVSHLVGWQEGAALAAHRAIHGIVDHIRQA